MKTKLFTWSFFALLIVVQMVNAYNIGYVVNNPSNLAANEIALRDFLRAQGHTVAILDDSVSQVSAYTLLIVSNSVINDIQFDNKNYKTLFLSSKIASRRGLSASYGMSSGRDVVVDRIEFITEGFSLGTRQLYISQSNINYVLSCFATNAKSLVYKSDRTRSVLLTVDKNSLLLNQGCSNRTLPLNERNVFFGLYKTEAWNDDAKKLFLRSVTWLVDGGLVDKDADSYIAIESGGNDCNDNDPTINPGASDITKNCRNDAPIISRATPSEQALNVLRNIKKEFSIEVQDEQVNTLIINWKIDGNVVGSGSNFSFTKNSGDYLLEVSVSDGEFITKKEWTIQVRDSSAFSCSQVGGQICSADTVCNSQVYHVNEAVVCCSVSCSAKPIAFKNVAKSCTTKNNNIEISFDNLADDNFYVHENIDFNLKIKNKLDKKSEFTSTSYIYDLTKEDALSKEKSSWTIQKDSIEEIDITLKIPDDARENNQFFLYSYVESEDRSCNENYQIIDIQRKSEEIIIDYFDFKDEVYFCGDSIEFEMGLQNLGTTNRNVDLEIENKELGIKIIDSVTLEKYGDDDSKKKTFVATLPETAKAGEHIIKANLGLSQKTISAEKKLLLGTCKYTVQEETSTEPIVIKGSSLPISENTKRFFENSGVPLYFLLILISIAFFSVTILFIFWRKQIITTKKIKSSQKK
ncbi:MAG: putative metal-binding motif-containing protein [Nanoarchaeota archaeon]